MTWEEYVWSIGQEGRELWLRRMDNQERLRQTYPKITKEMLEGDLPQMEKTVRW